MSQHVCCRLLSLSPVNYTARTLTYFLQLFIYVTQLLLQDLNVIGSVLLCEVYGIWHPQLPRQMLHTVHV